MAPPPPPPFGPEPELAGTTTGESRRDVNLLNLPASTRSLKRVGLGAPELLATSRATAGGTRTTSFELLARRGFANALRPSGPRKITVFFDRAGLKWRPRIVSSAPTRTRIGVTRVMVGVEALLPFLDGAAPAPAGSISTAAEASARQMRMVRRMASPYRRSLLLFESSSLSLATTTRSASISGSKRRGLPTDALARAPSALPALAPTAPG